MNLRFLDGLRGIAAFIVMLGHARLLLWEGYSSGYELHTTAYSALDRAMMYVFSIFRYGHEMVILFFILSGFVIHLRFSNREKRAPMRLKFFWFKRFKRLYPPLLFALLLAFILDSIGKSYGWSIYSQHTPYPNINREIVSVTDLKTLLGNLSFLMTVYVPTFGTTIATWSLMYEWWFYILYPFFYFLTLRVGFRKTTYWVILLFLLSFFKDRLAPLLLWKVLDNFIMWWMGACLVEIWTNRHGSTQKIYGYLPYLVFFLPGAFIGKEQNMGIINGFINLLFGLGFTGVLAILLELKSEHFFIRFLNKLKPLGDCSYTLYLVHVSIFVFISGWFIAQNGALPQHHFYVIGGTILVTILAYYLHFLIEKPFIKTKEGSTDVSSRKIFNLIPYKFIK